MAWSLSYSIVAKANSKVYFYNEVIATTYTFVLNILGYKYFGLTGFGISLIVAYTLYLIQVSVVCHRLFRFSFDKRIWRVFLSLNFICCSIVDN